MLSNSWFLRTACVIVIVGILQQLTTTTTTCSSVALAFTPSLLTTTSKRTPPSSSRSRLHHVLASSSNALEELSTMTKLSIDSGDLDLVDKYVAGMTTTGGLNIITDATTNPLFVSQAGSKGDQRYQDMVEDAITYAKEQKALGGGSDDAINLAMDKLAVNLGARILELLPSDGRVSTEVDIRLSYDTVASVERARRIIELYQTMGIDKSRILIKLAGTWEGIQAAGILEKEDGIQTNITLVFSFLQAVAAAQAGAYLISPFPGRILDWHKAASGRTSYHPTADPGVLAVRRMYAYFRKYDYPTICMPASWRPSRGTAIEGSDVDEILALAGVDEMTIPPPLLESLLQRDASDVTRHCDAAADAATCVDPDLKLTKEMWDQYWSADACGQDKLQEGIDAFTKETEKLKDILMEQFG